MWETLLWWLTSLALGIVALPVAALLLRALPDRGYTAARALGLLLVGWLAYMLAMAQALPFGRLSLLLCMLVVGGFSVWLLLRNGRAMFDDLRERFRSPAFLRHVLASELLFAVLLGVWAFFRAYNPEIIDQEKFMDFGILNAILKSGTFPPQDMWFSGESLNYYYFGYVLIAAVTSLSGVAPEISFNLANAFLFALTALMSYGVVYNLIQGTILRRARTASEPPMLPPDPPAPPVDDPLVGRLPRNREQAREETPVSRRATRSGRPVRQVRGFSSLTFALAAAPAGGTTYATVAEPPETRAAPIPQRRTRADRARQEAYAAPREMGKVGRGAPEHVPFFLSPILYGILGALMVVAMGNLAVPFAKKDLSVVGDMTGNGWAFCFFCQKQGYSYWWDPSRIIMDYRTTTAPDGTVNKAKVGFETINEFPAFSFVLGDMHPHTMALPFVLLAALAAYAVAMRKVNRSSRWRDGLPGSLAGWVGLLLTALIVGALYPTNTWDYPTYLGVVLVGAALPYIAAARRPQSGGWRWARPYIVYAALLLALSLILFAPFHLTFKSFAGGNPVALPENIAGIPVLGALLERLSTLFLLNSADKTITGFLVIFGIFLVALLGWLLYELARQLRRERQEEIEEERRNIAPLVVGGIVAVTLVIALLLRFPLLGLLLPIITVALFLVWREPRHIERNMALGLLLVAAGVGLAVEIVYLHDNFGNRMNTLFKFYYQMWVLMALAASYGLWRTLHAAFGPSRVASSEWRVASEGRAVGRGTQHSVHPGVKAAAVVWAALFLLLVASALPYAWYGSQERNVQGRTAAVGLDGMVFIGNTAPGDHAAIEWLNRNAGGDDVVLECCQNEYDWPGRISSFTGIPTLMAWDNSHEALWRSGQPELRAEVGRRRQVVNAIYQGTDPDAGGSPLTPARLLDILRTYSVDYVVVGAVERGQIAGRTGAISEAQRVTPYAENVMRAANMDVAFQSGNTIVYAVEGAQAGPDVVVPTPVGGPSPIAGTPQVDLNVPPVGLFERGLAGPNRGQFSLPRGIARDSEGNFYVSDTENKRIQKFDPSGEWLLAFGGRGEGDGQFAAISADSVGTGPGGLAVDSEGNVYVADTWNHRIQKFDSEGRFVAKWGSFISLADPATANAPDADTRFYGPRGVAIGPDGNVYVTDTGNKRVLVFGQEGKYLRQIESGLTREKLDANYPFNAPGELNEPVGIAVDAEGNVYVADTNNRRIQKFDAAGEPVAQWPVADPNWAPGPYLEPFLALDGAGNVYATAPSGRTVLKFSPDGELLGQKNTTGDFTLDLPTGLSVDNNGEVYVVDTNAHTVVRLGTIP